MATASSKMDALTEVTELERIPLPYKTLYHALVLKNDMPIDLMRERHQSGAEQLLTWIQAALNIVENVASTTSALAQQQEKDEDEDEDVELESEIQDVVSGFGVYEPTIESTIEILTCLEESIIQRTASELDQDLSSTYPSAEIENIREQWEKLQGIIRDLSGSNRDHQRLRDGIKGVRNLTEQTRQATEILEKCLADIAADRQRTSEQALAEAASPHGIITGLNRKGSIDNLLGKARSTAVDSNNILELISRCDLLNMQVETFQKSYPECARSSKAHKSKGRSSKQQESGSITEKKQLIYKLFKELSKDLNSLITRKDQLWQDLRECEQWRGRIEKMTSQIEEMLEPVEIFHKICVNLLATLDGHTPPPTPGVEDPIDPLVGTITSLEISQSPMSLLPTNTSSSSAQLGKNQAIELERLWATLQELDEKQNVVGPAIDNLFWVQEGELQHRSQSLVDSPASPTLAEYSPLYPTLSMVERQKKLRHRWSALKTSLDTVGSKLHTHHTLMKERADALRKREEDKMMVGSSTDGADRATSSPVPRRTNSNDSQRREAIAGIAPNWASRSHRFLRNRVVPSIAKETATVKKYMLVKGDLPEWSKPRPWCPSANPASPGMPGFPLQTAQWGYYLLTKSQNEGDFGTVIATPAPIPTRAPSPPPVAKPLKDTRPPFSPAGNRRHTTFPKPASTPRPIPERSISVAGGDIRAMTPMTASGDVMGWERTLRQSASFSVERQQPPPFRFSSNGMASRSNVNTPALPSNNNRAKRAASVADGNRPSGQFGGLQPMTPASNRRNSTMSRTGHHAGGWESRNAEAQRKTTAHGGNKKKNGSGNRRQSISSSEEGTVMGAPNVATKNNRRGGKLGPHQVKGSSPGRMNESTTSLDSMSSSGSSVVISRNYRRSSTTPSSVGASSPPPFTPMFGTSFEAARSSAALHSALLAMSSSSSAGSFRQSTSSLSESEQDSTQQFQSEKDKKRHQQQVMRLGSTSASSWMSMNMNLHTGSILSALSFSVPKYSFDEDFSSIGSMDESITAM
ncbi:hypothetical protein B0O80DRAFT_425275 [Mortierella sp. GBAus27b]|nr:hypothetical protein BGX31_003152 [Mortierella sp. GBA43]KAI8356410.1 hypothetical protein B0O80DRAFT_425275 [Mortierella sp. GBAus27b]